MTSVHTTPAGGSKAAVVDWVGLAGGLVLLGAAGAMAYTRRGLGARVRQQPFWQLTNVP